MSKSRVVQSILLPTNKYTIKKAKKWLKDHKKRYGKIHTTENYHRARQLEPELFYPSTFRTIDFDGNIKAVVGRMK